MQSTAGRLLVANPLLIDPNFARTVVLMVEHDTDGALGLVLNRPSDTAVVEIIEQWAHLAATPDVFFIGGPVSPESVICLGDSDQPIDGVHQVMDRISTIDLDDEPAAIAVAAVRLFAGYSGWGPGQLEGELGAEGWIVVPARATDALDPDPSTLWQRVLARQPGSLAWLATFPDELSVN